MYKLLCDSLLNLFLQIWVVHLPIGQEIGTGVPPGKSLVLSHMMHTSIWRSTPPMSIWKGRPPLALKNAPLPAPPPCPPPQSSWGERTPGTLLVVQCWLQQLCDSSNNVIFSNKLLHFSYKSLNVPSEKTIFLRNLCRLFPVLQHRCFPVNIAKFLITPVSKNICIWLLLKIIIKKNFLEKPLVTMIIKW